MMNFGPKAVRTEAALQRGAAEPALAAVERHTSASICGTVSAGGAAAKAGPTDSPPAVSALTAAARSRSRRLQSLLASVHSSGVGARLRLAARGGLGCGCQRHSAAMVIATPMGSARAELLSRLSSGVCTCSSAPGRRRSGGAPELALKPEGTKEGILDIHTRTRHRLERLTTNST